MYIGNLSQGRPLMRGVKVQCGRACSAPASTAKLAGPKPNKSVRGHPPRVRRHIDVQKAAHVVSIYEHIRLRAPGHQALVLQTGRAARDRRVRASVSGTEAVLGRVLHKNHPCAATLCSTLVQQPQSPAISLPSAHSAAHLLLRIGLRIVLHKPGGAAIDA